MNNGVKRAMDKVGGSYVLARLCGVSQPAVMKWLRVNCPAERAVQIEEQTGVSRIFIRPDLFKNKP